MSQGGATSPTLAYLDGRERILGRRVVVPLVDPAAAFEALCEALGGRQIAAEFVTQMLDEMPEVAPFDHPDDCRLCGTWRERLAGVGS